MRCNSVIVWLVMIMLAASCGTRTTGGEPDPACMAQTTEVTGAEGRRSRPASRQTEDHAREQVLVRFKEGTAGHVIETIQKELNLQTIRTFPRTSLYLMKISGGSCVEETIKRLRAFTEVEYAEPDYIRTIK